MRLARLGSAGPGVVTGSVVLSTGETVDATFATDSANGIDLVNPQTPPDLFRSDPEASVDDIRAICAAVVAFDIAAHGRRA